MNGQTYVFRLATHLDCQYAFRNQITRMRAHDPGTNDPAGFRVEQQLGKALGTTDTNCPAACCPREFAHFIINALFPGLDFGPRVQVMTAAGPAHAWMTRLDEVTVGGIRRRNVRASITSGEFNGVLLGMSFLKHYNLQQQDGTLVIRVAGSADG